ncbi:hypothetical protein [Patulibacter sp. SYSU D01012]|uniref:hypothetical protein n=1 Tax=Patulibacter sp. SYSU D01012 TaxID=2817381 RepID=UPI001B30FB3B|nr:hypothetical protein [Patulibacter sp. SYSU D01012]
MTSPSPDPARSADAPARDGDGWTRRGALGVAGLAGLAAAGIAAATCGGPGGAAEARGGFRPRDLAVFGHSWAAGTNVRRSRAWPALVARELGVARPPLFPTDAARRRDFAWGGARAVGPAAEHGAGWVLRSLPRGPRRPPSLVLLLTGDNDVSRHGDSPAALRLLGGGIHAALGRLLATEVHEEDEPAAWSFGPGWASERGDQRNSGRGVRYALADGATFAARLPAGYAGAPVTVGLPLWDATVRGTITWSVDGRPLARRTDLSALQGVLTRRDPSAVYAERFAGLPAGARELRGTWSSGGHRGAAVVVDAWSLEREDARIVCALMPERNPWGNDFGGVTVASNRANRQALAEHRGVRYVDLARAVLPTGTAADRRFWDSDASSHPTAAGERAIARVVAGAVRRMAPPQPL